MPLNVYAILALLAATSALAQQSDAPHQADSSKFDGKWSVTLVCPAQDDGVKGFTHHFAAEVKNGQLRGVYGTDGEPGWHLLQGAIAPDGSASMKLDGIVSNPDYAANRSPRGKRYPIVFGPRSSKLRAPVSVSASARVIFASRGSR